MPDVPYAVNPRGTTYDAKVAGDITVTAGGVAEFENPQTGNIGVGWKVIYNSITTYIAEMTDSTHANLVTAVGVAVSNQTATALTSIQAEYADVAAAEAGSGDANHLNTFDLTSGSFVLLWPCYYDDDDQTRDTSEPVIDGYTTDAGDYWKVYTPEGGTESINSQRHAGTWDDNKFIMEMDGSDASCSLRDNYGQAVGLQIDNIDTTNAFSFNFETAGSATNVIIEKCILRTGLNGKGLWLTGSSTTVRNNLIYCRGTPSSGSRGGTSIAGTNTIQYCTFLNLNGGIENDGTTPVLTNCCIFNTSNDVIGAATVTYCATEDGDGTNAVTLDNGTYAFSNIWTDYAGTPRDLSLVNDTSDTNAPQNKGTFISGVDEDILGNDRDNSTPDIGCFEFLADAGDDMTLADGFEFSDSVGMSASAPASMSDGFEFSDSASLTASVPMSMSDGFEMSDSSSLSAAGNMSLNDGFEFSDSFANVVSAIMSLSSGFEFSDTVQSTAALIMSLSDTAVFSDTLSFQSGNFMNLSDTFEFSDSLSFDTGVITMTLNDGFTFSDAFQSISSAVMSLDDGFVLSDSVSLSTAADLVEGPITVSVQVKQSKFDIVVKKSNVGISIKQPKFDIEVN